MVRHKVNQHILLETKDGMDNVLVKQVQDKISSGLKYGCADIWQLS